MTLFTADGYLKDMTRVHWIDPSWETSWGLGYAVSKGHKVSAITRISHRASLWEVRVVALTSPRLPGRTPWWSGTAAPAPATRRSSAPCRK